MSVPSRVDLEPAYVLHARPWRESSQLVEVLSQAHGRIGLVARGARSPRSPLRGLLAPFQPLRLSWSGRNELRTLRAAELAGNALALSGDNVLAGFYVNELLLKLLERDDAHPELFVLYGSLLAQLAEDSQCEPALRRFELAFLRELGYAPALERSAIDGTPLVTTARYEYRFDQGLIPAGSGAPGALCFSGAELLAINAGEFADPEQLANGKRLLRAVLNHYLGSRTLHSRRVAAAMKR